MSAGFDLCHAKTCLNSLESGSKSNFTTGRTTRKQGKMCISRLFPTSGAKGVPAALGAKESNSKGT